MLLQYKELFKGYKQIFNNSFPKCGGHWISPRISFIVISISFTLTWRYFAHCGRMPPISLVAVRTLNKDGTVTKTLCKHFSPNVI